MIGTIVAGMTAFYMFRLYFLTFFGESRVDHHTEHHIHESPPEMVGPLVILAIGAALGGLVGLPGGLFDKPELNALAHWLEPSVGPELHVSHALELGIMAASTVAAVVGIFSAKSFFGGGYREPAQRFVDAVPGFVALVRDKFRVDEAYSFLIIRPIRRVSEVLFIAVDRILIDKVLVHGVAIVTDVAARLARLIQVGDAQRHLAAFAIGVAAIFYMATRPAAPEELKVTVQGTVVSVDAGSEGTSGANLVYGFDFDGDGVEDRRGRNPVARFTYEGSGSYEIRVTIRDSRWNTRTTLEQKVRIR
jgi:NADH-quinone oxidoreductase subunit L